MFAEQACIAMSVQCAFHVIRQKDNKKEGMIGRLGVCTGTEISHIRHVLHVLKFYLKKGTYINVVT
jgi:hypothetical protein